MQIWNDKMKMNGPVTIEEDLSLDGMIAGDATVQRGVTLELGGMITGNLNVEPGARAIIRGMVNGLIRNQGGYIEIFGTVGGVADLSPDGRIVFHPGASVNLQLA